MAPSPVKEWILLVEDAYQLLYMKEYASDWSRIFVADLS